MVAFGMHRRVNTNRKKQVGLVSMVRNKGKLVPMVRIKVDLVPW